MFSLFSSRFRKFSNYTDTYNGEPNECEKFIVFARRFLLQEIMTMRRAILTLGEFSEYDNYGHYIPASGASRDNLRDLCHRTDADAHGMIVRMWHRPMDAELLRCCRLAPHNVWCGQLFLPPRRGPVAFANYYNSWRIRHWVPPKTSRPCRGVW